MLCKGSKPQRASQRGLRGRRVREHSPATACALDMSGPTCPHVAPILHLHPSPPHGSPCAVVLLSVAILQVRHHRDCTNGPTDRMLPSTLPSMRISPPQCRRHAQTPPTPPRRPPPAASGTPAPARGVPPSCTSSQTWRRLLLPSHRAPPAAAAPGRGRGPRGRGGVPATGGEAMAVNATDGDATLVT